MRVPASPLPRAICRPPPTVRREPRARREVLLRRGVGEAQGLRAEVWVISLCSTPQLIELTKGRASAVSAIPALALPAAPRAAFMRQVIDLTASAALLITPASSARRIFPRASESAYAGRRTRSSVAPAFRGVAVRNVPARASITEALFFARNRCDSAGHKAGGHLRSQ
jgi:hypothetical protein